MNSHSLEITGVNKGRKWNALAEEMRSNREASSSGIEAKEAIPQEAGNVAAARVNEDILQTPAAVTRSRDTGPAPMSGVEYASKAPILSLSSATVNPLILKL